MDRVVNGIFGETIKDRLQEPRELDLAHLAAAHCELAMANAAEAADVAVDGDVVRRERGRVARLIAPAAHRTGSR
jgi:hypothetical protein